MILLGFILILVNFSLLMFRYICAIIDVQQNILSINPIYIIIAITLPYLWWLYSTSRDNWNFYDIKHKTLNFTVIHSITTISQVTWTMIFNTVIVRVCMLPVGRNLNEKMILNLCRIILILTTCTLGYGLHFLIQKFLTSDEMQERIDGFRWQHIVDTRENKKQLYDLHIIKDMKTGKDVPIKEQDRFVHMFILGQSGTGKTSSTITPAVVCDLEQKLNNMEKRELQLQKMVEAGEAFVKKPNSNGLINEWCVDAKQGFEQKLANIRKAYPDCGLTIMAPNNSLNDDVIRLAKARGLSVNVIDPAFNYDEPNVRMLGINPFYLEPDIDGEERQIQISNKAQTFAEVLMAVSEINGTGDQYFRDINTSVTTNIGIMCMLRANLNGEQTSISEIQACINDFGKLKSIVNQIQDLLHMKVIVHTVGKKSASGITRVDDNDSNDTHYETDYQIIPVDYKDIPQRYIAKGYTVETYAEFLEMEAEAYYEPIHFVMSELLGDGNEKMFDQARGLRNLINKLLLDPRIKKVLSATEKNFIDWDKALAQNEITVINTALEFGPQGSTALGLFIMLNMKIAIMRRPKKNRSNHFIMIDEASQYMHPMYEDMFALFRQYRCATVLAMQSLSQMEKTEVTQYLKGVIMGAGIHIVFGRTNADEMKYYESMAGIESKETTQTSTTRNSEFDENNSVSVGSRTTIEQTKVLDGSKIRVRDFQQVTVYMIDNGRVKNGFIAKVSFPKKSDYAEKNVHHVDWTKYCTFDTSLYTNDENTISAINENCKKIIQKNRTKIKNTITKQDDDYSTLPKIEGDLEQINQPIPIETLHERKAVLDLKEAQIETFDFTAGKHLQIGKRTTTHSKNIDRQERTIYPHNHHPITRVDKPKQKEKVEIDENMLDDENIFSTIINAEELTNSPDIKSSTEIDRNKELLDSFKNRLIKKENTDITQDEQEELDEENELLKLQQIEYELDNPF